MRIDKVYMFHRWKDILPKTIEKNPAFGTIFDEYNYTRLPPRRRRKIFTLFALLEAILQSKTIIFWRVSKQNPSPFPQKFRALARRMTENRANFFHRCEKTGRIF